MEKDDKIEKIFSLTQQMDWSQIFLDLTSQYQFTFNLPKLIHCHGFQKIKQLSIYFFQLLLLYQSRQNLGNSSFDSNFQSQLSKIVVQIKECYYLIVQEHLHHKKLETIQIILFLIAMISKPALIELITIIEGNRLSEDEKQVSDDKQNHSLFQIQEEAYIIIIYQTLGKLISPHAFSILRKKFIRQIIHQISPIPSIKQIQQSMKIVKKNIITHHNLGVTRKQREKHNRVQAIILNPANQFIKEIKNHLKIKEPPPISINKSPEARLTEKIKLYGDSNKTVDCIRKQRCRRYSFETLSSSTKFFLKKEPASKKKTLFLQKDVVKKTERSTQKKTTKLKFNRLELKQRKERVNWMKVVSKLKLCSNRELGAVQKLSQTNMKNPSQKIISYSQRNSKQNTIYAPPQQDISLLTFPIISDIRQNFQAIPSKQQSKYISIQNPIVIKQNSASILNRGLRKKLNFSHELKKDNKKFEDRCQTRKLAIEEIDKCYRI